MAKKLGFGAMRLPLTNPSDLGSIDIEELKKMVDLFMERGFTYFDTAWMYCGEQSEPSLKKALVERYPRDSYTLTDKFPSYVPKSLEDRDKILMTQLERTGAGYYDYYLLHNINADTIANFDKYDCFNWIKTVKERGLAKHIGFSFHGTPEMLEELLTKYPFFEYVQLQINYIDWNNQGIRARECYEIATKHNKPVIVMEPVKGGTLANIPESAAKMFNDRKNGLSIPSWAIRFAASLPNVFMVLSGMSNLAQTDDNTSYMKDFEPLTEEENKLVLQVADAINASIAIPCTGCSYCTVDCPQNIAIPRYFSLYNADLLEIETKRIKPQSIYYENITKDYGKASDCLKCGMCEGHCPQHIEIREWLEKVAERFEK